MVKQVKYHETFLINDALTKIYKDEKDLVSWNSFLLEKDTFYRSSDSN